MTHLDYLRGQAGKALDRKDTIETFAGSFVEAWRPEARAVFLELQLERGNAASRASEPPAPEVAA
jgi:hypothetical protein